MQSAVLSTRHPGLSFPVVMASVPFPMGLIGDRPRRTAAGFDVFRAFGGDGGAGGG